MGHPISHGFLLILLFSSIIFTKHACDLAERNALSSLLITQSSPPLNWTASVDCCQWEGITCDQGGRIIRLQLPSKGLKGGMFLSSLKNLTHLSHLNLSHNLLSGPVDAGLFLALIHLEILDLSFNLLSGQISSSICFNSSLVRVLDFSDNDFKGSIPLGLGNCSKLEVFRAGFNTLSGFLPSDIYNAQTLQEISLPYNKISGPIGENILNLTNLRIMDLSFNQVRGILPLHIGKLSKLELMLLHYNNLEGPLPLSLLNCTNLIELNLGFNRFSGNISALDFSKLTELSKLDFVYNTFTGIFPISLYSCKSLKALRLATNDLEGQIQPEILSLKSLSFLSLSENRFTNVKGAMKILKHFKGLRVLLLSKTFQGEEMPDGNIILKKLEVLDLSFNRLTGSIPGWLGNLPSLFFVWLNNNLISGEFPKELCRLQALVSQYAPNQTAQGYHFEFPIYFLRDDNSSLHSSQYKYPSSMPRAISLKNNSLSGNIPFEIGQLQYLQKLDLSVNNFSGNIPNQISNLKNLETLDLSRNHLSGGIPASLSSLNFLASFSVAYNNLEGSIPTGTQLQGFGATAFESNPGLCGSPLPNECGQMNTSNNTTENMEDVKGNGNEIPWFRISVALGFIVGFLGVCGPLALSRSWRYAYFQFLSNVKDHFVC
nr:receptor-like protein 3 [Malus domestica]